MRAIVLAAGLVCLAASGAFAGTASNPDFVRDQQGSTLAISYQTLGAATSACVIAPTGTTCTGGVNHATGSLRSVTIVNIGANDAFCDETSPAVASQGELIKASGGAMTVAKSTASLVLYCISTAGTTLSVRQEK